MTIQMKATEQYFPVVVVILLYKVALIVESVDQILRCDYSNECDPEEYSRYVEQCGLWTKS